MMSSVGLLLFGSFSFAMAWNALWPRRTPVELAAVSFFAGWLTAELAFHILALHALIVALFVDYGALAAWPGRLGLGLALAAAGLLVLSVRLSASSRGIIAEALVALPVVEVEPRPWRQLFFPIPVTHPQVEQVRDVVFYQEGPLRLRLDVHRRRGERPASAPALIYVHGGGWIIGSRRTQGLPTVQRMAARGWVCFNIEYRLSPAATFPDHVIDVKRAIAWVRQNAASWGADPSFIVIAGGSAGAHLASLAALTPNRADWQPGFESADTRVQGCVSYYGVYDFTDRFGHWPARGLRMVLERWVLKARLDEARPRFADASPLEHVGPGAPPFLVVHGSRDTIVPVEEARQFVAALRGQGVEPCAYVEVPGAQHAFEVFPSLRTVALLDGVERFVGYLRQRAKGKDLPQRTQGTQRPE